MHSTVCWHYETELCVKYGFLHIWDWVITDLCGCWCACVCPCLCMLIKTWTCAKAPPYLWQPSGECAAVTIITKFQFPSLPFVFSGGQVSYANLLAWLVNAWCSVVQTECAIKFRRAGLSLAFWGPWARFGWGAPLPCAQNIEVAPL